MKIDVKWLLFLIGIVAISGIALAATAPYITNSGASIFDALQVTGNGTFGSGSAQLFFDATHGRIGGGSHAPNRVLDLTGFADHAALPINYYWGFSNDNGATVSAGWGYDGTSLTVSGMANSAQPNAACVNTTNSRITYNSGQTTCVASSEKVKHNIETLTSTHDFDKVRSVTFVYNNDAQNRTRVGLIAEELALISPEVINTDYSGTGTFIKIVTDTVTGKASGALYSDGKTANITGISYELYTAILTKKIQEQQFQLDVQSAQIRNICTNNPQLCS